LPFDYELQNMDVIARVRHVRHQILSHALSDPDYESEAMLRKKAAIAIRILRRSDLGTPMPDNMMEVLNSKPQGPYKFATILADKTRQLLALDRYERRALSRRKFALRAFDVAGRRKPNLTTIAACYRTIILRTKLHFGRTNPKNSIFSGRTREPSRQESVSVPTGVGGGGGGGPPALAMDIPPIEKHKVWPGPLSSRHTGSWPLSRLTPLYILHRSPLFAVFALWV
jgi:hypothetical protein